MPEQRLCLRISNDIAELPASLDAVDEFLRTWRVTPVDHAQVMVIADEIAANIIRNAWPAGGVHHFTVGLSVAPGTAVLNLTLLATDDGIPFDPTLAVDPALDLALDDRQPGGLGLFFIREMSDSLHYERRDGCNALLMCKLLAHNGEA